MTAARHAAIRPVRSSWWVPLAQWRNWPLLVKLAAVLLVPALLAITLGVVQIQGDVARADSYAAMQRLVTMRGELRTLLESLQMERTLSVERLGDTVTVTPAALRQQKQRVDSARKAVIRTGGEDASLSGAAAKRYQDAVSLLTGLPTLRTQVASGHIASWTALNDYTTIDQGLLNLDQALSSLYTVPQLARTASTLYDLEAAEEQIHLQHVIVLQAVGRGHAMNPTLAEALQVSDVRLQDGLDDFRNVATPAELADYQRTVTGAEVSRRTRTVDKALAVSPRSGALLNAAGPLPIPVGTWNSDSEGTGMLVGKVADDTTRALRTTSATLQDQASNRAGVASVIVFAVLLLALVVGLAIGRHLLRSLAILRRTALDVAEHRLPAAVASLREGQAADVAIGIVPVHTTEEFGQLARAFDTVHSEAVRLAAEQAGLRGDLRNTLVNLSRRSQSLVDRLLLLMEQLERREQDPDQLASLFALDHLATRMRRNNENMMVLCGNTLVRGLHQRMALDTVLRGALSEIERYQRVLVQPSPPVDVMGYAAGDLGRLIAELLDNATAFSPPHTQVTVGGSRESDGSVVIEIQDQGIGMGEGDLAMANRRVAAGTASDTPASRQLGLFVVGRLAERHGIAVDLSSQPGRTGLRVRVRLPAPLVNAQAPARRDHQGALAERLTPAGLPGRASRGRMDAGKRVLTTRPYAGASRRPAPSGQSGQSGPRQPAGQPWFADAASASATASPGTAKPARAADAPVRRAAPVRPQAAPPSSPEPPSGRVPAREPAREPAADRSASAPADRRPEGQARQAGQAGQATQTGQAGQERDGAPGVTRAGLPRRAAGGTAPEPDAPADVTQAGLPLRAPGRAVQEPDAPTDVTPTGLPRRPPPVRSAPPARAEHSPAGDGAPKALDAGRAHSFLSSYQSGLQRARPDETQNPSATGRKKP